MQSSLWFRVVLVILLVLALGAWSSVLFGWFGRSDFPSIESGRFQAVFLANNQVYFGHLENFDAGFTRLTKVYYLRAAGDLQQGTSQASGQNLNLVKLGGELHGPEDAMFIPKDKILFWENMRSDSDVVKAIEKSSL